MAAGGGEVAVGFLPQSGLGVSAVAVSGGPSYTNIKLDELTEGPGYITDEGRPEVGGSLAIISSTEKYGAAPFVSMTGKQRIETIPLLLPVVGWNAGTPASGVTPYTPVAASSAFKYHTADYKYSSEVGNQYQTLDMRGTRLVLDYTPRRAPTFTLDALGGNMQASTADHAAPASETVPSPVATILAANSTFFGVAGFKVYGFVFTIENGIDNTQQPLGQFTPDDVVPTFISSRINLLIQMSNASYRRLVYGGSAATAISAAKATGAMNMRISSGDGTKYVEFDFSAAEYFLGDPRPTRATEQVLLPVRARCTGTATVWVKP